MVKVIKGGEKLRFGVELTLEKDRIPKDKNRIFISLLKSNFESYDKNYYKKLYEEEKNKIKDFTFSLYMGKCEFLRDEIIIRDKKIYLNFSTYNNEDGIMFYNSFLSNVGKEIKIKDNSMKIQKINLLKEKAICSDEIIFKVMSPLVSREHRGDNKSTWYHSLQTEEGQAVLLENIKYQLKDVFGEKSMVDIEEVDIAIERNMKQVKVKNYGIEVLGNLGFIKIDAKPYLLDYLYKAGVGSKRSGGFGMVDIM